ncbi:MAG: ribosomal RNA small subunit methyltransferase A, partial [Micromonosporaceae bacterium]
MTALLGPAEIRQIASRLGIRPTKTLGQNFVIDPNTVQRIVRAAHLRPDDVVLEVGPGLGSLTLALLPAAARVYAVEVDPVLAGALPDTVTRYAPEAADRLTVVTGDALRLTPSELPGPPPAPGGPSRPGAPTALVANLPYNVAVPVVLELLASFPTVARGLVMVQSEVADRLVAP